MKQRSPSPAICIFLSVILICVILVPVVSAATKTTPTPKPTATVPPVLQACSHAKYPEARFTCNFTGNQSPLIPDGPPFAVDCFDNSTTESDQPIVSWKWEFGDGKTSTDQNPHHTYTDASQYNVSLTVTTWCGGKYFNTTAGKMLVYCTVPEPVFTTNVSEGYAPLTVQAIDLSRNTPINATTWTYWFDDAHFSHQRNPVYTYTRPGTYTINQSVWKDCVQMGSALHPPAMQQIKVNPPPPVSIDGNETNITPAATLPVPTPSVASELPAPNTTPDTSVPIVPLAGSLSVKTEPAGAQVYLDGIRQGTSPVTVPDLPTGSHTLRLEREGYQNLTVPVSINDGKVTSFSTTLVPAAGGIALLPVIALILIILGVVGAGIYLVISRRQE
jgi:hypothetical protein